MESKEIRMGVSNVKNKELICCRA